MEKRITVTGERTEGLIRTVNLTMCTLSLVKCRRMTVLGPFPSDFSRGYSDSFIRNRSCSKKNIDLVVFTRGIE